MSVSFSLDSNAFFAQLSDREKRQVPQALKETVFKVTQDRQARLKRHVGTVLTIRKGRTLLLNSIRFEKADYPTKDNPTATLRVYNGQSNGAAPGAQADVFRRFGAILARQDQAGRQTSSARYRTPTKRLVTGGFAVPAKGLRGPSKLPRRNTYPAAIGVAENSGTRSASMNTTGKQRRKAVQPDSNFYFVKENLGIFVRKQVGTKSKYSALWFFRRQFTLPSRVKLKETFLDGLATQLEQTFPIEFGKALSTAR